MISATIWLFGLPGVVACSKKYYFKYSQKWILDLTKHYRYPGNILSFTNISWIFFTFNELKFQIQVLD